MISPIALARQFGITAALAVILSGSLAATVNAQATAERSGRVDVRGARVIRIRAGAGYLHVNGHGGASTVEAHGTARASSSSLLQSIKLIVRRNGDVAEVITDMPENLGSSWRDEYAELDLTVEVPSTMRLEVEDGSGDTIMRDIGPISFTDGSGGIDIDGVNGDLDISDGSGDLTARHVKGNATIHDGSGGIYLYDVSGSVEIPSDGSGEVRVERVGGDFTVESKGSGSIDYSDVKGKVSVPERHGRGRWRRDDS